MKSAGSRWKFLPGTESHQPRSSKGWYVAEASTAEGDIGNKAREAWTKLDIADEPYMYAMTGISFENGQVVVWVESTSDYALRDVTARVETIINGERTAPRQHTIAYVPATGSRIVHTGIHYREEDEMHVTTSVIAANHAS